ncbi:PIN domain protein [Synechococcus sp. WH 8103]|nr:PIN domain protein [Synechococcus sp. WH 8103]
MIGLLDVNVLIALLDPQHVHHDPAHHWFAQHGSAGWATCPLTQNDVLRILGHPRYPNSPGSPAAVMPLLIGLLSHSVHQFWADALSWSATSAIRVDQVLAHGQITDVYLLSLAVHHLGMLVSFDSGINTQVVAGGQDALHLIRSSP